MKTPQPTGGVYYVGIIGPKPHSLGGHDIEDNRLRREIFYKIKDVLTHVAKEHHVVVGLTGLNLGVEQDFAHCCLGAKIDYEIYLPYLEQEELWQNLPNVYNQYIQLLASGLTYTTLNIGSYSPKKNSQKNQKIVKDADLILYIHDMRGEDSQLYEMVKNNAKDFMVISPN